MTVFCVHLVKDQPQTGACGAVRGLQRDVVYLGWPIAPSYTSPNARGWGVVSTAVYITWHGAQINFGDLTPYLTYGCSSPSGKAAWTVYQVQNHTLLGLSSPASQPAGPPCLASPLAFGLIGLNKPDTSKYWLTGGEFWWKHLKKRVNKYTGMQRNTGRKEVKN